MVTLSVPQASPMDHQTCETLSVPEAGKRYYGLSRNGSYAAAKRGDIPTIAVGKLLRVPRALMDRKLEQAAANATDAIGAR
jgi:hypothetical protein